MFSGLLSPLSADLPLSQLLAHASVSEDLGAWIPGGVAVLRIYRVARVPRGRVLASSDLGFLVGRCSRIAVRQGQQVEVLAAEAVIQWRALQVATATPYLPGLERLRALFPELRSTASGLVVPIGGQSPEEVLARCLAEGVRVTGSRIVYSR
jgi:hypothetical protein